MRLYKAKYVIKIRGEAGTRKLSLYILASDFQTAVKLAETNERISPFLQADGDPRSMLSNVELIAFDVIQG
jgi:hypothetical protein